MHLLVIQTYSFALFFFTRSSEFTEGTSIMLAYALNAFKVMLLKVNRSVLSLLKCTRAGSHRVYTLTCRLHVHRAFGSNLIHAADL